MFAIQLITNAAINCTKNGALLTMGRKRKFKKTFKQQKNSKSHDGSHAAYAWLHQRKKRRKTEKIVTDEWKEN